MQDFYTLWNFPNCCGAMDGKHIVIRCPSKSGSEFYNYSKDYSVILLAIVDANYKFMYIVVGTNGRVNDALVFSKSTFNEVLQTNALNLPKGVFVGDDAFPLRKNHNEALQYEKAVDYKREDIQLQIVKSTPCF